jgi:hypothetical protein
MDSKAIIGICVVASFVAFGRVAQRYIWPHVSRLERDRGLDRLITPHMFRFAGMSFLMAGVVSPEMSPAFAAPAAYGDLAAAVLAMVAVFALARKASWALAAVWLFNIEGTADLLFAYYQGVVGAPLPAGALGAAFYIPAVLVPPLLVLHALIFVLLMRPAAASS